MTWLVTLSTSVRPSPTNRNRWIETLRPAMPSASVFVRKNAAVS